MIYIVDVSFIFKMRCVVLIIGKKVIYGYKNKFIIIKFYLVVVIE